MVTKHKLSHFLHLRKRLHSPKEEEGSKEKDSDPYCQVTSSKNILVYWCIQI